MIIKNAKIFTMNENIIENGFIRIKEDRIEEIGCCSTLKITDKNQAVIDMKGGFLLPAFIDSHCHLGMWTEGLGFEGDDGNEDTDPITPHLRAIDSINAMDISFDEAAKSGVTVAVTGVGSGNPIGGSFAVIKTNGSRRVDDLIVKNPVAIKFALGENPKVTYNDREQTPTTRMAVAALIRENLFKAVRYRDDLDKYHQNLGTDDEIDLPEYDVRMEALLPVLNGEVQAHFHCHRADDIFTAVRIANEFNLDYVLIHCTEGALIADELEREINRENVKIVLGPLINNRSKPELMNATIKTAKVLADKGIKFAICTDHPETPIQYLPLTAAIAVRGGLSHEKAIEAITINAAKVSRIDGDFGTLEVGKKAEIVGFIGDVSNVFDVTVMPSLIISNGRVISNKL